MSARDDILAGTWQQDPDPRAQALALSGLLARYAHELAQRQRNWDAEAEGYTDPQMAVYAVADLIDPEVPDA